MIAMCGRPEMQIFLSCASGIEGWDASRWPKEARATHASFELQVKDTYPRLGVAVPCVVRNRKRSLPCVNGDGHACGFWFRGKLYPTQAQRQGLYGPPRSFLARTAVGYQSHSWTEVGKVGHKAEATGMTPGTSQRLWIGLRCGGFASGSRP